MNVGKEQVKRLDITVSSGSGTGTITNQWDIARRIRCAPPSESTTYKMTIKDGSGFLIFNSDATGSVLTGTLSMLNETSLGIAKTVEISSGSQDGVYTVLFDLH